MTVTHRRLLSLDTLHRLKYHGGDYSEFINSIESFLALISAEDDPPKRLWCLCVHCRTAPFRMHYRPGDHYRCAYCEHPIVSIPTPDSAFKFIERALRADHNSKINIAVNELLAHYHRWIGRNMSAVIQGLKAEMENHNDTRPTQAT